MGSNVNFKSYKQGCSDPRFLLYYIIFMDLKVFKKRIVKKFKDTNALLKFLKLVLTNFK